jgi:hypothetical protein
MEYKNFMQLLEQSARKRIKPLPLLTSSLPTRIPEAFRWTIPSIIAVLDANLNKICPARNKIIAIYSLKIATLAIWSKILHPDRIIDSINKQYHFICILSYMLVEQEKLATITVWTSEATHNIAIDFTTGEIMDQNCYFKKAHCPQPDSGMIYGYIDPRELTIAWEIFNKTSKGLPYGLSIVDKNYPN